MSDSGNSSWNVNSDSENSEIRMPTRRRFLRTGVKVAGVLAAGSIVGAAVFRPEDQGGEYQPYFKQLNEALAETGLGRPCIVLDLDRVDKNLDRIGDHLKSPLAYRVVTKSLPSAALIQYVMGKTGTSKVMAFHQPFLGELIDNLGTRLDVLLGKPLPVEAVQRYLQERPPEKIKSDAETIQWLVDTPERLSQYLALARHMGLRFRLNVEIDVELHRGGAPDPESAGRMIKEILDHTDIASFTGFMGYDGHVAHAPGLPGLHEYAVRRAFAHSIDKYRSFVEYGRRHFTDAFGHELTLNGGGSKSYELFEAGMPVNDVAAGSMAVKPSTFDIFTLADHVPALFIAAPVIKKEAGFNVPFLESVKGLVGWYDPNSRMTYYIYGGGWAGDMAAPPGVRQTAITSDPPNQNLVPNQTMLSGSARTPLNIGDYVFYHPHQGDAIFQFEDILLYRRGRIEGAWKPFHNRY
jgi:D-serine deaminase-like pyridoxal phosphate-dependent protein